MRSMTDLALECRNNAPELYKLLKKILFECENQDCPMKIEEKTFGEAIALVKHLEGRN